MSPLENLLLESGAAGPLVLLLLALCTFASEDLACLIAGVLVARGDVGLAPATLACFTGIVASDAGLFFAGRWVGRPLLRAAPLRRLVESGAFERSRAWVDRHGPTVILASRFAPGTRVATHVTAGLVGLDIRACLRAMVTGAALWTPLLVGGSMLAVRWGAAAGLPTGVPWAAASAAALLGALHAAHALATRSRRRRLAGLWLRATRWEFWPPWAFYPPIVAWIGVLMLRYRSATVFTAANPAIPAGGVVGESKTDILRALSAGGAPVAPFIPLLAGGAAESRRAHARAFAERHGLPVVLKPDKGQRGTGVAIVNSAPELDATVDGTRGDAILQVYVPGPEFGLFYARLPGEARGRIISMTAKRLPQVIGDGRRTLEELVLEDPRAVAMAGVYRAINRERLDQVPAAGAPVTIADVGSHCRGAIFHDAAALLTPALEEAVERASRACAGFAFGRFDVRAESIDALRAGRFTILELNGVTSEPTHVYDPAHGLLYAWRTVARTWSLAFAIGHEQARRGARVWSLREVAALALSYRRATRRLPRPSLPETSQPALHRTDRSYTQGRTSDRSSLG